jgi:hypothetical protein
VFVRPDVRELSGAVGTHLDPLRQRQHVEQTGDGYDGVELDRVDPGGQQRR